MRKLLLVMIQIGVLFLSSNIYAEGLKKEPITVGIVVFEGFLTSEISGPVEVFGHPIVEGEQPFEVLLIAESMASISSHEGLRILPDVTFSNSPELDVLIVPSSYNLKVSEENEKVIAFVKNQGKKVKYLASNCAGAFILGEAGLIDGRKVVTYVGGGESLQKRFPKALVQDEFKNHVMIDGNLITSNGALISYESAFVLLEKLVGKTQATRAAGDLYYTRLLN